MMIYPLAPRTKFWSVKPRASNLTGSDYLFYEPIQARINDQPHDKSKKNFYFQTNQWYKDDSFKGRIMKVSEHNVELFKVRDTYERFIDLSSIRDAIFVSSIALGFNVSTKKSSFPGGLLS